MKKNILTNLCPIAISDEDVMEAMKHISGYLDITPGDFKEIYEIAYSHAIDRFLYSIRARDIMTQPVIFARQNDPLVKVAKILSEKHLSGVPILDDLNEIVGMISEKDFLFHMGVTGTGSFMKVVSQCLKNKGCVAFEIRKQLASDIMKTPVITAREDIPVFEIARLFLEKNINRVPILDRSGKMTGIVTRNDIVSTYCHTGEYKRK